MHSIFISCKVEMILNSQPFGVLHDNNVEQILTPNDLLFGRKLNEGNVSAKFDTNKLTDLNTQLKHINNLINHLWNRWHSVYMPLQIPKKFTRKQTVSYLVLAMLLIFTRKIIPF